MLWPAAAASAAAAVVEASASASAAAVVAAAEVVAGWAEFGGWAGAVVCRLKPVGRWAMGLGCGVWGCGVVGCGLTSSLARKGRTRTATTTALGGVPAPSGLAAPDMGRVALFRRGWCVGSRPSAASRGALPSYFDNCHELIEV